MAKLREKMWLLGESAGSHHTEQAEHYHLPGVNKMTPIEGCRFYNIPNCCRCCMQAGPFPPFDSESAELVECKEVIWSIIGSGGVRRNEAEGGDIDEVIRQAKMFPNITGAFLDDFFSERRMGIFTPEMLVRFKEKLNREIGRKIDLWCVYYEREYLNRDRIKPYLDVCDVITYWIWKASEMPKLRFYLDHLVEYTPGKRRIAGCYLWNYGEGKPYTPEEMQFQLDVYLEYIKAGVIEGLMICSNCCSDIGLPTVDQMLEWLDKNGDIEVK